VLLLSLLINALETEKPHMAALFEMLSKIAPLPYAGIIRIRFEGSSIVWTLSRCYSPRA
jgi:hypothetical protein